LVNWVNISLEIYIISALPIPTNNNYPKGIVELYASFFDRDILLEQSEQVEALRT